MVLHACSLFFQIQYLTQLKRFKVEENKRCSAVNSCLCKHWCDTWTLLLKKVAVTGDASVSAYLHEHKKCLKKNTKQKTNGNKEPTKDVRLTIKSGGPAENIEPQWHIAAQYFSVHFLTLTSYHIKHEKHCSYHTEIYKASL